MIIEEAVFKYKTRRIVRLNEIYATYFSGCDVGNTYDFITVAESGVNASILTVFADHFNLERDVVASILDSSEPTIYRWIKNDKDLEVNTTIRLLELSNLFLIGEEVFENKDKFFTWVGLSSQALGGMTPLQLLAIPEGISKVKQLLGRIEHGVYS